MRTLVEQLITSAAMAAGFDASAVMDKPERENPMLLPSARVQFEFLPAALTWSPRRIAKFASQYNPETHRTVRTRTYERAILVRVELITADETFLETATLAFLAALPGKTADGNGNLVKIRASKAELRGFESKTVEVVTRRSTLIHIQFTDMICTDEDVPLITSVNLVDNLSVE